MRTELRSLGIDLSTVATGVVLLREHAPVPIVEMETEIKRPDYTGWDQKSRIVQAVMEFANEVRPDRIVLEGYSLNMKHASSVIPLVELGGLLRFTLHLDGFKWYDPRATEVKKFVTGKGTSPKEVVMMHVLKRWGHTSMTNNTADAFVCAAMGLAQANALAGVTMEMRSIAGAMKALAN
jgi:crossover junction endodeoxyribonuclease RuvC